MLVSPTALTFGTDYSTLITDPGSDAAIVSRLYQALLGRQADGYGFASWLDALQTGANLQMVSAAISASTEAGASASQPDADFVTSLYVSILGRGIDADGLAFWTAQLATGATRGDVALSFVSSAEAATAWAVANPEGIEAPNKAALTVAMLYDTAFGRAPDADGLAFWTQLLNSGTLSVAQMADGLAGSEEFRAEFPADDTVALIRGLYANSFNRLPSEAEIASHLEALQSGQSLGTLLLNFALSAEQASGFAFSLEGGLNEGVVPTSFTTSLVDGVVVFGGTATGIITLSLDESGARLEREGISISLPGFDDATGLTVGDATLQAPAAALSGKQVEGSGTVLVTDASAETDLSALSPELDVTLRVDTSEDLSANGTLGRVDSILVVDGAVVTLSVAQAGAVAVTGAYAIRDLAAAMLPGGAADPALAAATTVTITDTVAIEALAILAAAGIEAVCEALSGTATALLADIAANGGDGLFVRPGIAVLVTSSASLAEIGLIDTANGAAGVSVTAITDTAALLVPGGVAAGRVTAGVALSVTDAATIAQLAALDQANGDAGLQFSAVQDTAANLLANDAAYLSSGIDVTVEGPVSVTELAGIDALNGDGSLQFSAASGTADQLLSSGFLRDGLDVAVTGPATLAQLAQIDAAAGTGNLAYVALADSIGNLIDDAGLYVLPGVDVTVTDPADVAQLATIDGRNGSGALLYGAITDAAALLAADTTYLKADTDVTVTDVASIAQLTAIDGRNGDGALVAPQIMDGWAALTASDASAYVAAATTVRLASYSLGTVAVADVAALLALPHLVDAMGDPIALADLTFALLDQPASLAAASAAAIVTAATAVTASAAASVSQATVIHGLDTTASYDIADSAATLATTNTAAEAAIRAAVDLEALTVASAARGSIIHDRGGVGETLYDLQDSFSNINGLIAAVRDDARNLTVTGGGIVSAANAATAVGYGNDGATTIRNIRDTAEQVHAFVASHQETTGATALSYDFSVLDSTTGVLGAIDAGHLSFITGNAAADVTGDQRAGAITVTGTFSAATAETFWTAIDDGFGQDSATAALRSYYGVTDTVAHYSNEQAASAWIVNADHLHVTDTAANVSAAQSGQDSDHADMFQLIASRASSADNLVVTGSAGSQFIQGTAGSDSIDMGADNDQVSAGGGSDVVYGGTGVDFLDGGAGRDTLYAGAAAADTVWNTAIGSGGANTVIGGADGDNMFSSTIFDAYRYQGSTREGLIAESGTTQSTRDYITNFGIGDRLYLDGADNVQFFGSGSANAKATEGLGLAIRYDKNVQLLNYDGSALVEGTRVLIDVADGQGLFDDVADMHIVLVGQNIELNWDNGALLFGG